MYGIVQRREGTMEILSKMGRGTTIRLSLPAETTGPPREEPSPASARTNGPLRVLVVDDEPLVRRLLVDYLAVDGHSVETAGSGREGLEKFRGERFDVLITDRAMPEMGGDQVAVAIKDLAPGTPDVMLTGFGKLMRGAHVPRVWTAS